MRDAERIRLAEHLLALERALRDALTAVEGIRRVVEHAGNVATRSSAPVKSM
jgi:hypothetical protein